MRRQDSETQDRTAREGGRLLRAPQGDGKAGTGEQDGDAERRGGQPQPVAACDARLEGQHRDEMGGPDADTAGRGRNPDPYGPHATLALSRMGEQADGRERRQHADADGKADEHHIVLANEAPVDTQHRQPISCSEPE